MKTDEAGEIIPVKDVVEQDALEDIPKIVLGNLYDKENENPTPTPDDLDERDIYEQDKLEDVLKQARGDDARIGEFTFGFLNKESGNNIDNGDDRKNSTLMPDDLDEREIYDQDKLEDVFKQARGDDAGTGGFSFGFLNQEPGEIIVNGDGSFVPSSLGFDHVTRETQERDTFYGDTKADAIPTAATMTEETAATVTTVIEGEGRPRSKQSGGRKSFSQSDLDEYEKLFFGLNEGPEILEDLEGMRHNKENQERWQKERQVLTDDWKRKQKSAFSKKGKKARR
jgi:hypothetical protein